MCNRYASDIRKAGKECDYYGFDEWSETRINPIVGNAALEVFPKSYGPVLKLGVGGKLEWNKKRWGLPGPPQFGSAPVTNIRNVKSPHWRTLLQPQHRCLVPFTAFSEYEDASPRGKKVIRWFAPPDRRHALLCRHRQRVLRRLRLQEGAERRYAPALLLPHHRSQ